MDTEGAAKTANLLNVIQNETSDAQDDAQNDDTDYSHYALSIDVVLRKILSFLNLNHLKQIRLVNRFWNSLAVPYIKQECDYISFNDDNYWTNMRNHGIEDMARFTECVNESPNFPFVKLDLGTSVIKDHPHELILTKFISTISSSVVALSIRDEWGQNLFTDVPSETFSFPCLEMFRIHFLQPMNNGEDITANFNFFTSILRNSPSLRKVVLIDHNRMDDGKVVSFFLNAIEAANAKRFVRLEIEAQIENHHLVQLSKMGLKLQYLFMDFWGSIISQDNLKLFLTDQSDTVEHLKIADFAMSSDFVVDFPSMKRLKSLIIKGSLLGRICISFPNISYVKQFPVLRRLSFSNAMEEWDEFLKFGIQPVQTVEELKLPVDFVDEKCLQHAAHIFPRLKKIEIPAILGIANIVYDSMPNIEELILNTKYVDLIDDIITGLSIEVCEDIRTYDESMRNLIFREHMQLITTKPLSSLQRLKILRLKCKRPTDPVELTDTSCLMVLLNMTSLKCLDLWKRDPNYGRISPEVYCAMRQKFTVLGCPYQ